MATAVMTLPPPADGMSYAAEEVAAICGVEVKTVRQWIWRGKRSAKRKGFRRLTSLATPRGHVAPRELCDWMSEVNGIRVALKA